METENNRPKVGVGVMVFKDGKILLGKRRGSFGAGEYSFPGGHLEYLESFENCARRETKEESGIEIKNVKFLCVGNIIDYKPKHFVTLLFIAEWEGGELKVCEPEKCEFWDWYDIDKLPQPMFSFSQQGIESYKSGKNYFDIEK